MTYQVAVGFNNEGSLQDLTVQPSSPGIEYPEFVIAGDMTGDFDGPPFIDLVYSMVTETTWPTILEDMGLDSANSSQNTWCLFNRDTGDFEPYNGTVYKPTPKWVNRFAEVKFRVVGLEAL